MTTLTFLSTSTLSRENTVPNDPNYCLLCMADLNIDHDANCGACDHHRDDDNPTIWLARVAMEHLADFVEHAHHTTWGMGVGPVVVAGHELGAEAPAEGLPLSLPPSRPKELPVLLADVVRRLCPDAHAELIATGEVIIYTGVMAS